MSRLNQVTKMRVTNRRMFLDSASLQFRFMVSVVGISVIALITYQWLSRWELQTLLMMQPERLTSNQLIAIAERSMTLSVILMIMMTIAVLGVQPGYVQNRTRCKVILS